MFYRGFSLIHLLEVYSLLLRSSLLILLSVNRHALMEPPRMIDDVN